MVVYDWFRRFIYWISLPFILISYLCEPLSDDVHVYLGAAKIQLLTGGFPMVLDSVWESRLIGHRFLYYVLNIVSAPFPGWWYSIVMKSLVAIVTICILYYFSRKVSVRLSVPFDYVFVLGFLGLFAINDFIIFSAEIQSVIISMLMTVMLMDDRRWIQVLSGLLILPLLILKGLPVLLVLIVMFTVMMFEPDYMNRFKRMVLSLPIVGAALIGLSLYFPHFISDIFLLRMMNHPRTADVFVLGYRFMFSGIGMVGMVPVIVLGVCSMFLLMSIVMKEQMRDLTLLVLMWLVGTVYVIIIGEFWYYHYCLMIVPAVLTGCYFLKLYPNHQEAFVLTVVAVLVLFVTIVAGWSPGMGLAVYHQSNERDVVVLNLTTTTDLLQQPTTLYLDEGQSSFYFPTRSACRYISPQPYRRDMPDWDMTSRPEYWETRSCILNYTGKYIIINRNWLGLDISTHREIVEMLDTEYTDTYPNIFHAEVPAGNNSWDIYQRR